MQIEGKVFIVTGGASGLGEGTARMLEAAGGKVVVAETLPALNGGGSFVKLSNGAEASMFKLIPGTLPKLTCVRAIGMATGELTRAMYDVKLDLQSPTAPYYDVFRAHHAVTRSGFYATVAGPDFDGVRGATDYLVDELRKVEKTIEECHALKLPMSWIHGDAQCVPFSLALLCTN
jgi:hypothetical protein